MENEHMLFLKFKLCPPDLTFKKLTQFKTNNERQTALHLFLELIHSHFFAL